MAGAVLQGHKIGIRADKAAVVLQCGHRKHGLNKNEDEIHSAQTRSTRRSQGTIDPVLAILLADNHAISVDLFYSFFIDIDQPHLIMLGQIAPE